MPEGIYMTEDQREIGRKKRVIEYAEEIGHVGIACRHFGIARSTFYLWRDRYRESGDEGLKSRERNYLSFLRPRSTCMIGDLGVVRSAE